MLLHLLNRSPASSQVPQDALRAMGAHDRLLLIESAVYGAVAPQADLFAALEGRCFALREDLVSRGLVEHCAPWIAMVDMAEFVDLTAQTQRTVSWY
ncbi:MULTISPECIES: sulfurtransferase complex subunit TusB [unclassified Modicisalibacter]|uniref:sulfurtransferase complex subunit TusB n=1 Tax=unclassified Modicisalibacter TaxID=2679913 RepID=UPI001CC9E040|nr:MULTISPECIES: sulfurtransferase complex subunit TusB [unclassified Modicisalibacter]MBZ9556692.1 sulfurtransferase complex subunit TusB [Modicisalibacter sp. R2A 31.J]MBZ9574839.1 sulfurtransferase complex subunit TusB [Modicisalibacter sp. MOD 31.J]